jgi:hypothetical protein
MAGVVVRSGFDHQDAIVRNSAKPLYPWLAGLRGRGLGVAAAMPSQLCHSALAQDADSCSHDHSEDFGEHFVQTSQHGVGCLNERSSFSNFYR